MVNLKSFNQFINEGLESTINFVDSCVDDILKDLTQIDSSALISKEFSKLTTLEYNDDEYKVDVEVFFRLDDDLDISKDIHFNKIPWEEINYNHYGFAIDANMIINQADLIIPKVEVHLILNKNMIPKLYKELKFRLIDIITHELNHTQQVGMNRLPFNSRPTSSKERSKAGVFGYLVLPEEIESMVEGMYVRSKKQGVPIDKIFDKYLIPFVMSNSLKKEEYFKVLQTWIYYTLENYPDADLSLEDDKIRKIVNSI
tara:strand:+ start:330 stop:1100 length:771 start_codon:yes stop_codon:yes gene_type:complete